MNISNFFDIKSLATAVVAFLGGRIWEKLNVNKKYYQLIRKQANVVISDLLKDYAREEDYNSSMLEAANFIDLNGDEMVRHRKTKKILDFLNEVKFRVIKAKSYSKRYDRDPTDSSNTQLLVDNDAWLAFHVDLFINNNSSFKLQLSKFNYSLNPFIQKKPFWKF